MNISNPFDDADMLIDDEPIGHEEEDEYDEEDEDEEEDEEQQEEEQEEEDELDVQDEEKDDDDGVGGSRIEEGDENMNSEMNSEEEEMIPEPKGPLKKPVSAFLHFCAENRAVVKDRLPNASAGEVTKTISESWRSLNEAEKKRFMDIAIADRERYEREKKKYPAAAALSSSTNSKGNTKGLEPHETVIPISRVKKIAKLDPQLRSLSKEANALITKMTELFVAKLATETHSASSGKRIIKLSDVAHCIHNRPQFAWLRPDYPMQDYKADKKSTQPKQIQKPENNTTIQQFFKPAASSSEKSRPNSPPQSAHSDFENALPPPSDDDNDDDANMPPPAPIRQQHQDFQYEATADDDDDDL